MMWAEDGAVEMGGRKGYRKGWCVVEGWKFKDDGWGLRMEGEGRVVVKGDSELDVGEVVGIVVGEEATGVDVGDWEKEGMEVLGVFVVDVRNQDMTGPKMRRNLMVQK